MTEDRKSSKPTAIVTGSGQRYITRDFTTQELVAMWEQAIQLGMERVILVFTICPEDTVAHVIWDCIESIEEVGPAEATKLEFKSELRGR